MKKVHRHVPLPLHPPPCHLAPGRAVCVSGFGSPMDSTGVLRSDPKPFLGKERQMTSAATSKGGPRDTRNRLLGRLSKPSTYGLNPFRINRMQFCGRLSNQPFPQVIFAPFDPHRRSSGADHLRSARTRPRRASLGTHRCLLNQLSCRLKTAVNPLKINRVQFWNRLSNRLLRQVLLAPFDHHCSFAGADHLSSARTRPRRGPSVTPLRLRNRHLRTISNRHNQRKIKRVQ